MIHKTHVSFALCVCLAPVAALSYFGSLNLSQETLMQFIAAISIGALFPDIDEPQSKIGQKFTAVSNLIKTLFGHRGVTHFFIVPAILAVLFLIFLPANSTYIALGSGFILGYTLHIVGDAFTKSGIQNAFWPFFKNKAFGMLPKEFRFYTNSTVELKLVLPLTMILCGIEVYQIFGSDLKIGNQNLEQILNQILKALL
ncbi:predicted membrane-bound metal-dependent hydrolase (DUF457 domain) [Campylobacter iguaniorum]|uniref:Predicted membrane-bound metal-dependent hydrolase (DUF457 domain) n=1 Tax=Campylobacter iguaniorum TaxID=1244531 RepID=A0A076FA22_9BACT|nr:metal-dependent hydrolase [Campylobacter iguaniorum]AII14806.1 predicted membrane-bound metal-dependent hydrolase (DUF457 domain) [Campylobacter iguaniorum]